MASRRRKLTLGVIGVAVVVILAATLGPYVYIHFIEGPAPAKLELPTSSTTTSHAPGGSTSTSSSSIAGTWNVGAGSQAGYRVQEVLVGQNATAVGRTSKIWGSLTIAGTTVTDGKFTVDMASVVSDQSQRNARFNGPIMNVSRYPTATLTLSSPIDLGSIPVAGVVTKYNAVGALDYAWSDEVGDVPRLSRTREWRDRGAGRHPDHVFGMEYRQPEYRWFRHDGEQRDTRGPPSSHARRGKCAIHFVRVGGPGRWRRAGDGPQYDGPSALRAFRLAAQTHHPGRATTTPVYLSCPSSPFHPVWLCRALLPGRPLPRPDADWVCPQGDRRPTTREEP